MLIILGLGSWHWKTLELLAQLPVLRLYLLTPQFTRRTHVKPYAIYYIKFYHAEQQRTLRMFSVAF